MGTVGSKNTRSISFDNTFAIPTPLAVESIIEENDHVMDLNAITAVTVEKNDELMFPESDNLPIPENEEKEVDYWTNRIESLKQEHRLINKIIETEYEQTLEKNNVLINEPLNGLETNKLKTCFDWRNKILQCYEDNPHQPLMCSSLAKAFNECVTSCRIQE